MTKISIIIPTLNESEQIQDLLNYLHEQSNTGLINEIIIVDGGSSDGTLELIKESPNVRLIHSEKGRARQLNAGAKVATSEVLYFLHADSLPPPKYDQLILAEVYKGHPAGCFRLKFHSTHWWLQLAGWFTQFNWKICRGGDQSLFITQKLFQELGGYDEDYLIYEDNILIETLFKRKTHVVIKAYITTSARLYEKLGVWKLQYHFWRIHLKHRFGASPEELLLYYRRHVS